MDIKDWIKIKPKKDILNNFERRKNYSINCFTQYDENNNNGNNHKGDQVILLFGGANDNKTFKDNFRLIVSNDFSEFVLENVSIMNPSNITLRSHHTMSYDSRRSKMIIYGGRTSKRICSEIMIYNLRSKEKWLAETSGKMIKSSTSTFFHSSVLYSDKKIMMMFGGIVNLNTPYTYTNKLVIYDLISQVVTGLSVKDTPSARAGHSAVKYADAMIIFGGRDNHQCFNDVYKFVIGKRIFQKLETSGDIPLPRHNHCCIVRNHKMIVTGGYDLNSNKCINNSHVLDLVTLVWSKFSDLPEELDVDGAVIYKDKLLVVGSNDKESFCSYFIDLPLELPSLRTSVVDFEDLETMNKRNSRIFDTSENDLILNGKDDVEGNVLKENSVIYVEGEVHTVEFVKQYEEKNVNINEINEETIEVKSVEEKSLDSVVEEEGNKKKLTREITPLNLDLLKGTLEDHEELKENKLVEETVEDTEEDTEEDEEESDEVNVFQKGDEPKEEVIKKDDQINEVKEEVTKQEETKTSTDTQPNGGGLRKWALRQISPRKVYSKSASTLEVTSTKETFDDLSVSPPTENDSSIQYTPRSPPNTKISFLENIKEEEKDGDEEVVQREKSNTIGSEKSIKKNNNNSLKKRSKSYLAEKNPPPRVISNPNSSPNDNSFFTHEVRQKTFSIGRKKKKGSVGALFLQQSRMEISPRSSASEKETTVIDDSDDFGILEEIAETSANGDDNSERTVKSENDIKTNQEKIHDKINDPLSRNRFSLNDLKSRLSDQVDDNLALLNYDNFLKKLLKVTFLPESGKFFSDTLGKEGDHQSLLASKYLEVEKIIRDTLLHSQSIIGRIQHNTKQENTNNGNKSKRDLDEDTIQTEEDFSFQSNIDPVDDLLEKTEDFEDDTMEDKSDPEKKKIRKRKFIVQELLSTEKTYVSFLSSAINGYKKPIESKQALTVENINIIFSNIESIYLLHKNFLDELEPLVSNFSEECVLSGVFKTFTQSLKIYSEYINNFENSTNVLRISMNDSSFEKLINSLYDHSGNKNELRALLISPVQRIPRYKLLLSDLLNNTLEIHPDKSGIEEAHDKISELAIWINEKKREFENYSKMSRINRHLLYEETNDVKPIDLIAPHRKLIYDGKILMKCRTNEGVKWLDKHVFLFNDVVLITTEKMKRKNAYYIVDQDLIPVINIIVENVQDEVEDLNNVFRIVLTNGQSTVKKMFFSTSENQQKELWISKINEQIQYFTKSNGLSNSGDLEVTPVRKWSNSKSTSFNKSGEDIKNWFELKYRRSKPSSDNNTENENNGEVKEEIKSTPESSPRTPKGETGGVRKFALNRKHSSTAPVEIRSNTSECLTSSYGNEESVRDGKGSPTGLRSFALRMNKSQDTEGETDKVPSSPKPETPTTPKSGLRKWAQRKSDILDVEQTSPSTSPRNDPPPSSPRTEGMRKWALKRNETPSPIQNQLNQQNNVNSESQNDSNSEDNNKDNNKDKNNNNIENKETPETPPSSGGTRRWANKMNTTDVKSYFEQKYRKGNQNTNK